MSGSRKITDLERLTKPGGTVLPDDETIPVLTERLSLPSLELDVSLPETAQHAGALPDAGPPAPAGEAENTAFPGAGGAAVDVEAMLPPPATPVAVAAAMPPAAAVSEGAPKAAPETSSEPAPGAAIDWTQVEQQAREGLLRELQSRLASELDRQLRERLQPTLVRMLLATVTELRPSIEAAVRESVARAVAAEVERQRSLK